MDDNMEQWRGKVVKTGIGMQLASLRVDVELPKFKAGQFTQIGLPDGETMLAPRLLWLTVRRENHMQFYFFNKVPDGPLSSRLHQLKAGDTFIYPPRLLDF